MLGDLGRARGWHHHARGLWRHGRHRDACAAQDRAVALVSRGAATPERIRETAFMATARAGYAHALADHPAAAAAFERADACWASLPPDGAVTPARVAGLLGWGTTERLRGRHRAAFELLTTATGLAAHLEPAVRAATVNALGVLAKDTGDHDGALARYREALALLPDGRAHDGLRATLQHNVAGVAHVRGDLAEAEEPARRAVALRRAIPGVDPCAVASDETVLGAVLAGLGRLDEAETLLRAAHDVWSSRYGSEHYEVAVTLHNLAAVEQARGRLDEAERMFGDVVRIKRTVLGDGHAEVAAALNNLAAVRVELGRHDEALAGYDDAVRILRAAVGDDHPHTVACLRNRDAASAGPGGSRGRRAGASA